MVIVLVSGTGVKPRIDIISPDVKGAADVTSPLLFTANLRAVFAPYTLAFTVARVVFTGAPVTPTPVTSPVRMMTPEGTDIGVVVTFVTSPLPFTVTTGIDTLLP